MQRHRNPANGYRSSPIGIGGGGGGIAAGGPGYRNYNRGGFGRGQPPPPRRVDVFMEAGKLAAEYLVSKGLLPPNSLNGRWQNSNLKNQIGGGNDLSDAVSGTGTGSGSGRRRFVDDYSSAAGSRDGIRGRRTIESFKNPAIESNREVNRSSSLSEKVKSSLDKQGDGESFSGSVEEQKSGKDGGVSEDQKSVSGDTELKSVTNRQSQSQSQSQSPDENAGIKTPISEERIDGVKNMNAGTDDVAMDDGDGEPEKQIVKEEPPEEDNDKTANNNSSDLLTLIRFNKIPTRTRSSVSLKGSKSDPVLISGDENRNKEDNRNQEVSHEPEPKIEQASSEDDKVYKSGHGFQEVSHQPEPKIEQASSEDDDKYKPGGGFQEVSRQPELKIEEASSEDDNKYKSGRGFQEVSRQPELKNEQASSEDNNTYESGYGLHTRSLSFPQRSSITDQELSDLQHGFTRSHSDLLGGGTKRPLQISDSPETAKKPRDWASSNLPADDYLHNLTSRNRSSPKESTQGVIEEKQLFPSTSEIHDINSMEVSDVHDSNSVIGFSSVEQAKQEPMSVDFDLTMNSRGDTDIIDRHDKGVEVIDLDCDSMQEDNENDNDNNNSDRREDAIFTDLESFPDSMQRVSNIPQDGYGLMISELLDADIPNSSVSTGVNSMHNEISLPNDEAMLADDDSIYMSLGEIPISFVPVWDQQPSQRYDKRY